MNPDPPKKKQSNQNDLDTLTSFQLRVTAMATFPAISQVVIALLALRGVGRRTANIIAESCQQLPESNTDFSRHILAHKNRRLSKLSAEDCDAAWALAETTLAAAAKEGVTILTSTDPLFPAQLSAIPDPPIVLFAKGDLSCLQRRCVAIIGSREATARGLTCAETASVACVSADFVVASGLAAGIDTAAHKACLNAKGGTIAVLAHGLRNIFPPENRGLAENIVQGGGLLLTEYLPDTPPIGPRFVERDRIQSGLSEAVLLIESAANGGSMNTVRFAADQRRALTAMTFPQNMPEGNTIAIETHGATPLSDPSEMTGFLDRLQPLQAQPEYLWDYDSD